MHIYMKPIIIYKHRRECKYRISSQRIDFRTYAAWQYESNHRCVHPLWTIVPVCWVERDSSVDPDPPTPWCVGRRTNAVHRDDRQLHFVELLRPFGARSDRALREHCRHILRNRIFHRVLHLLDHGFVQVLSQRADLQSLCSLLLYPHSQMFPSKRPLLLQWKLMVRVTIF